MKVFVTCFLLLYSFLSQAQKVFIHSHNDYQQAVPLINALQNRVYSIEADIYLVNDTLKVAHDKKDLSKAPALHDLYIQPIIDLFRANNGRISRDSVYAPALMIDIKENGDAVLNALVKTLSEYPLVFDRKINPKAVQIVISGDRGDRSRWITRPAFILFDGRINEQYNKEQLERIALISDSYLNYTRQKDSIDSRIKQLTAKAHQMGKPVRLWAIPDNSASWTHLQELGVDIINTDKVADCRKMFAVKY
jgi:hypothetical protein